ncbi:hypothetical protein [Luteimonas terricola]|uniref:Lipoprotein n=1 Tax=Luteimonas terricola TaxID=645597 RepID=A0ABQ2E508_9GAMM|nr:hypothetical protein [Luteimonas terricola]GGJ96059.1 hypothetical protein GCM10011394_01060 [Luteimonas terricola]
MRHLLLPLLIAGLVATATGCQRAADAAAEAAIERASGHQVEVDRDGNRMRVRTAEGEVSIATGNGVALPADFPDDLFLPPSYGVSSVMDIGGARLLSLESDGSVSSMFDAARAAMEGSGWTQTLAMQQADSAMLGFSHGEREATYTFTRRGGEQLMVGIQLRERPGQQ